MIRKTLTANIGSTLLPRPALMRQIGHARFVPGVAKAQKLGQGQAFDLGTALQRMLQWNAL